MSEEPEEAEARRWYDQKTTWMEELLGREHDKVLHSLVGFAAGGWLHLYYYPNGVPGTGIGTKELCPLPDEGATNRVYHSYELVMFTRHAIDLDASRDESTPFGRAHLSISAMLNCVARFSTDAELNPNETLEFPSSMERIGGRCLIFDGYGQESDEGFLEFGLLLLMEIFRSEMEFARKNGGAKLIARLKAAGAYPYSDLDREPVA